MNQTHTTKTHTTIHKISQDSNQKCLDLYVLEIQRLADRANDGFPVKAAITSTISSAFKRFREAGPAVFDDMTTDFSVVLAQIAYVMHGAQPAFRDAMRFARQEAQRLQRDIFQIGELAA